MPSDIVDVHKFVQGLHLTITSTLPLFFCLIPCWFYKGLSLLDSFFDVSGGLKQMEDTARSMLPRSCLGHAASQQLRPMLRRGGFSLCGQAARQSAKTAFAPEASPPHICGIRCGSFVSICNKSSEDSAC